MELIVKDDAFFSHAGGRIFGTIYFHADEYAFPCVDWTDFTEEVLTMWANELLNRNNRHYSHFTLYFMDGDYWLDVCKDNKMHLTVKCMDNNTSVHEFECDYFDFLSIVNDGMRSLLSLLHKRQKEAIDRDFSNTIRCLERFSDQIEHAIPI